MVNSSSTTVKNSDANKIDSTSLAMKLSASLSILFNQFNNVSREQKNVVNYIHFGIDQFQTLKFLEKDKSLSLFHKNACS